MAKRAKSLLLFFIALPFRQSMALVPALDSCTDSGLNWYVKAIGETPCMTYQRMSQLCDPQFQVGSMNSKYPPDTCENNVVNCCCNSIAFSLSMLCLTCQQGAGQSGIGFDAPAGTYQKYLGMDFTQNNKGCSPNTNKTLPADIELAVCRNDIKLFDGFYNRVFWSDGAWFFRFTSDFITEQLSAKGNTGALHKCPASVVTTSTIPSTTTSNASPDGRNDAAGSTTSSKLGTGAIVGIVVGVLAVLILLGLGGFYLYSLGRRQAKQESDIGSDPRSPMTVATAPSFWSPPPHEDISSATSQATSPSTGTYTTFSRRSHARTASASVAAGGEELGSPPAYTPISPQDRGLVDLVPQRKGLS